jgi:TldD protein
MADLRELEGELAATLRRLEPRTKFAEILAQAQSGEGVRIERKTTTMSREPRVRGAVIRAWAGTRWAEAATSRLDGASLHEAEAALEHALSTAASGGGPPGEPSTLRSESTDDASGSKRGLSSEEMLSFSRDVMRWATAVPGVSNAQAGVGWTDEERLYVNTAGARCYQMLHRVIGGCVPFAIENGRAENDYVYFGSLGSSELFNFMSEERVTQTAKSARELLSARAPPAGELSVVLDPSTSGTFAHESFGHGTEADQFVRDRSYLRPILGQTVGPATLTLVDEGSYPHGWGSIWFDDEGRASQRTVLVDRGRFVGALHDRETAATLHARPTGNARRSDFLSRLFVRMTNTYVEAGEWTFEELVKEVKDGVVLEHATSGIEDPQGGQMQLKVKRGQRIEHGQLTGPVRSMALSGKVLDFLQQIRGVSRQSDFEMTPGYCGKGHSDLLPVGSGGTFLLSTAVVGPA